MMAYDDFETLLVSTQGPCVLHVQINRPAKRNAMNAKFWVEFRDCFERIAEDSDVRVVVVSGAGASTLPHMALPCAKQSSSSSALDSYRVPCRKSEVP